MENENDIKEALDRAYDDLLGGQVEQNSEVDIPMPVDIYHEREKRGRELGKSPMKHGSSQAVIMATKAVEETLAPQYRQYKGGYDHLMEIGETERATQLRQQYLVENFLPAVEAVIQRTSPDDLLNCKEAMEMLNQYAGSIAPKGYLEGYVRQAYGQMLGQGMQQSDAITLHTLKKITAMSAQGMATAAAAMAKQLKNSIDRGEQMASEADYTIISRVANY